MKHSGFDRPQARAPGEDETHLSTVLGAHDTNPTPRPPARIPRTLLLAARISSTTTRRQEDEMTLRDISEAVGKGLFAGLVGTAAMTVSSTLEMKRRGRPASSAPATAAAKVLGVEPAGEHERERFSNLVHWGYGTGWGAVRGLIGAMGINGGKAAAVHYGAVWGSELVMLPSLDIGVPPAWKWGGKEVGIDAFHHLVYAGATSAAYELLNR